MAHFHEIIAAGAHIRIPEGLDENRFTSIQIDVTKPETLKGICKGVDTVISTIGLTDASTEFNNYDIDFKGNLNLLKIARRARVKNFVYISVINADKGKGIPMVHSKFLFEEKLKQSGLNYVIYRPTGYFYDIAHVFWPMIKSKSVQLLKVKKDPVANVIDTADFAVFMMDVLARLPKIRKSGRSDVIRFSKFTLTNDCYGDTEVPGKSFNEYIAEKSYATE